MFDGLYYYNGVERLNLFFGQPNYAGAFLVSFVILMWMFDLIPERKKSVTIIVFIVFTELFLFYLVCKTYSRGAVVSLVVASFVYHCLWLFNLQRFGEGFDVYGRFLVRWFFKVVVAICLIGFTGFGSRLSSDYISSDVGVLNRLEIWERSIQMAYVSPVGGWGEGLSGIAFVNWFQPLSKDYEVFSMVSSVFTVLVEYGFIVWASVISVAFLVFLVGVMGKPRAPNGKNCMTFYLYNQLSITLTCVVVGYVISSLFTNIKEDYRVGLVPVICVCVLFFLVLARFIILNKVHVVLLLVLFNIALSVSFVAYGKSLERNASTIVSFDGECIKLVGKGSHGKWLVSADRQVLGNRLGRSIRRFTPYVKEINVIWPELNAEVDFSGRVYDRLLVFGQSNLSEYRHSLSDETEKVLINPVGYPMQEGELDWDLVLLPEFSNLFSSKASWVDFCREKEIRFDSIKGVGDDVRSILPDQIIEILKNKL